MNNELTVLWQLMKISNGQSNIDQWFNTLEQARKNIYKENEKKYQDENQKKRDKTVFEKYIIPSLERGAEQAILEAIIRDTKAEIDLKL